MPIGDETEKSLMVRIRVALDAIPGARFFRNNSGVDLDRKVRYGLGKGSADLIGIVDGRFVSIEIKTPRGRATPEQRAWRDTVVRMGGFACFVTSPAEAVAFVSEVRAAIGASK